MSKLASLSNSEVIYSTPRFDVVRRLEFDQAHYFVRKPDAVTVVVEQNKRYLLLDIRRGDSEVSLEFPGGRIEPGESALEAAARELEEEVGVAPPRLERIAKIKPLPGMVSETVHVFLARVSDDATLAGVVGHEGIEASRWADAEELGRLCAGGRITSAVDGYVALLVCLTR